MRELRKHKEQLRRKYRYEAQVIQSAIDKISENRKPSVADKNLAKRYEDFSKLTTFVKWMENDDFWRSEIVQITARTTESGAIDLELTPRSGNYTILSAAWTMPSRNWISCCGFTGRDSEKPDGIGTGRST